MDISITVARFGASEAERITGVSAMRQRDFRRHGYLPPITGRARFDVFELAELFVLKIMMDRNIGPQEAMNVTDICALGIVWHALMEKGAFAGDFSILDEVINMPPRQGLDAGGLDIINRALVKQGLDPINDIAEFYRILEQGEHQDYLRRRLWNLTKKPRVIPAEYFVWWADGSHLWCHGLDEAFDDLSPSDPKRVGSVIVLNLASLGLQFHANAQCSFASFTVAEGGEE